MAIFPSYVRSRDSKKIVLQTGFQNKYHMTRELLGRGGYGSVWRAFHLQTGESVAVKIVQASACSTYSGVSDCGLEKSSLVEHRTPFKDLRELEILSLISSKQDGILGLREAFIEGNCLYLVMTEMAEDLCDSLLARKCPFDEDSVRILCHTLLKGLEYLHSHHIIHMDVKLDNIFLERTGDLGSARLGDFGLSMFTQWTTENELKGSLHYMAPELLFACAYNHGQPGSKTGGTRNTTATDLWSVGVVLYALMSQRFPYGGKSEDIIKKNILENRLDLKRNCFCEISEEAKDLLRRLLESDPQKRISAKEALQHPWFQCKAYSFISLRRRIREAEKNLSSTLKAAIKRTLPFPLWSTVQVHGQARCLKTIDGLPLQHVCDVIISA